MENALKYFRKRCQDLSMCLNTSPDKERLKKVIEHNEKAVEALEKQIPKKPIKNPYETSSFQKYYCPSCGRYFGNDKRRDCAFLFEERYCQGKNCGQAIDWGENQKE